MAYDINTINTMLNTPGTTNRYMSDAGVYGCLQNTYALGNLVGFKSTTPGGAGSVYTTWPAVATCYLTVYGNGTIAVSNGTTQYWFYVFGSGYSGNAYEVYAADLGGGYGTFGGDTINAWITIGTYKQWYVQAGAAAYKNLGLYFRNSYFPQTTYGAWSIYAERLI